MTIAAIIAIILIFVCIRIFSNDTNEKPKGNQNFYKDNFDKEAWKNYNIHYDSENKINPEDFLNGKYNGIKFKKK